MYYVKGVLQSKLYQSITVMHLLEVLLHEAVALNEIDSDCNHIEILVVGAARTDSLRKLIVYCKGDMSHLRNQTGCSSALQPSWWRCPAFHCTCHQDATEGFQHETRCQNGRTTN